MSIKNTAGHQLEAIYSNADYIANNPTWHAEDSSWKADKIFSTLRRKLGYAFYLLKPAQRTRSSAVFLEWLIPISAP